ncbi:hypothetical protein PPERSA_03667 [Pseudocohnilembus persalinus]|uniref:adenosine deaminase n=1 Tax=Pseudocohnilembus persalinus TaxID=266149 RepID=A0A0V0QNL8_PSEPJ|nr:hypothetical protein PPERSA_03667 [Pseudocohnilembus persalinus]|eukprot:KRX03706.1 hypothetical protein PPERSA_03667 [Pseudocohnilembus persalinus]
MAISQNTQIYQSLKQILQKAPKPQLHLHLDGSLPSEYVIENFPKLKQKQETQNLFKNFVEIPENIKTDLELRTHFRNIKKIQYKNDSKQEKARNWGTFDFMNQFLQTKEEITHLVEVVMLGLFEKEGVNLLELRFAPILHTLLGLNQEEIIEAASVGFKNGQKVIQDKYGQKMYGGLLLCGLRSFPPEENENLMILIDKLQKQGNNIILGYDLAGDEGYHITLHEKSFQIGKKLGIKMTCHAGEWNEQFKSVDSIKYAIQYGCNRIGHGLTLRSANQELIEEISQKKIGVEVCLTSNCSTESKCKWYDVHTIKLMIEKDIKVAGLNCDNLLLSGSDICKYYFLYMLIQQLYRKII